MIIKACLQMQYLTKRLRSPALAVCGMDQALFGVFADFTTLAKKEEAFYGFQTA